MVTETNIIDACRPVARSTYSENYAIINITMLITVSYTKYHSDTHGHYTLYNEYSQDREV